MTKSYIDRPLLEARLHEAIRRSPVTAIIGPRQCGKTTLARSLAKSMPEVHLFDLEDPGSISRLRSPMLTLKPLRGLIVIDEIQIKPDLFGILRVLVDDPETVDRRFLILGSASPDLIGASGETLAGRIEYLRMTGFGVDEVGAKNEQKLWFRGGFPRSFLAHSVSDSDAWRSNFVETFMERDIRRFGVTVPQEALRRLWIMLAHYHGQVLNASELGRSLDESYATIKRHVDILVGSLMIRRVTPWHENLKKRQVKAPKLYVRDSGILHNLLSIDHKEELESHPKLGASWEGFVVEQIIARTGPRDVFFWGTYSGAELDLLLFRKGRRIGVEIKFSDSPSITKSMHSAIESLSLDILYVVCPQQEAYALSEKIFVRSLTALLNELSEIASP